MELSIFRLKADQDDYEIGWWSDLICDDVGGYLPLIRLWKLLLESCTIRLALV